MNKKPFDNLPHRRALDKMARKNPEALLGAVVGQEQARIAREAADYHRRALGSMARDIARAQAERETAEVLRRARCPLCKPIGCVGVSLCNHGENCPPDCGYRMASMSEQPAPLRVRTWLAEDSNAMAAMLPPTWLQRLKTKLRLFCDGWIDPTVRG